MYAKSDAAVAMADEDLMMDAVASDFLFNGIDRAELEAIMQEVFANADADGNGVLTMSEFIKCMEEAEIGLKKDEIKALMFQIDENEDGYVSYEEFVPVCFEILVKLTKENMKTQSAN